MGIMGIWCLLGWPTAGSYILWTHRFAYHMSPVSPAQFHSHPSSTTPQQKPSQN